MKTYRRRWGVWIGLAWTPLLLSNCAHKPPPTAEQQSQAELEYYQTQLRSVVKDPDRAEKLAGLASDFQKLIVAEMPAINGYHAKLAALKASYSATRADYAAVITQNDKDRSLFEQKVIALRMQMAALESDEEWEQLKTARMRGLEEALKGTP